MRKMCFILAVLLVSQCFGIPGTFGQSQQTPADELRSVSVKPVRYTVPQDTPLNALMGDILPAGEYTGSRYRLSVLRGQVALDTDTYALVVPQTVLWKTGRWKHVMSLEARVNEEVAKKLIIPSE
jgi:hypothetical protein